MDRVSSQARSRIMSLVKSQSGKTTERRLRASLVGAGISGWQMNCKHLPGKPDFVFPKKRLTVFVDGCFWHGCKCKRLSKTRPWFWAKKISDNKKRDRKVVRKLKSAGWSVLRIRECHLKTESGRASTLREIKEVLS